MFQAGKPLYLSGGVFQEALIHGKISYHEISDVTNALLDGVTGFILKDCDDIELLLNVIEIMNDLCCFIETFTNSKTDFWRIIDEVNNKYFCSSLQKTWMFVVFIRFFQNSTSLCNY